MSQCTTVGLWLGVLVFLSVALPAGASGIVTSNPFYRVSNVSTQSNIGEDFATYAFLEPRTNTTGDLSLTTSSAYAIASGYSDGFVMNASSSVDGAGLTIGGLDSVTAEGSSWFELDIRLPEHSTRSAQLTLEYMFDLTLVSSDPRPEFGEPGTDSGSHVRSIRLFDDVTGGVLQSAALQPGEHIFQALLDPSVPYRLQVIFNAITGVKESIGFATADANLALSISASAVPEPSTGVLVGLGLVGLAIHQRPVDDARRPSRCSGPATDRLN